MKTGGSRFFFEFSHVWLNQWRKIGEPWVANRACTACVCVCKISEQMLVFIKKVHFQKLCDIKNMNNCLVLTDCSSFSPIVLYKSAAEKKFIGIRRPCHTVRAYPYQVACRGSCPVAYQVACQVAYLADQRDSKVTVNLCH